MPSEICIKNSLLDNSRDSIEINMDGEKLVLFSGRIVRKNGALAFGGPLAQFFLTVAMGKAVWLQKVGEQEEVCIGVKAKDIRVAHDSASDSVSVFGKVEKKSLGGLNEFVKVRLVKDVIVLQTGNEIEYKDGDSIRLQFSRNNAILFRYSSDSFTWERMPLAQSAI
jgi:ABC-type sugar transport system ATPase subunit